MILELGCGINPSNNVDVRHDKTKHADHVDVAHDLDVFPWPWVDGEFDRIIAVDVLEHLTQPLERILDECWRILADNGQLAIEVPHCQSWHAWADPTHCRAFHDITFRYFDPDSKWCDLYGFQFDAKPWRIAECTRHKWPSEYGDATDLRVVMVKRAQPQ